MSFGPLLESMRSKKLLVVGDVMLDEYIFGRATRISPEAPVMVVHHQSTLRLPGGAANVAKNVAAFGADVHLIGVAGSDEGGSLLLHALKESGLSATLIPASGRATTRKTRVLADARHQVLRIDHEEDSPVSDEVAESILSEVMERILDCDAVILSDYRKGSMTERVARVIHQTAKANWKPLIVNAKPASLPYYRGATVISLNRSEASEAWGQPISITNALEAAGELRERHRAEAVVITLGDAGMAVSGPDAFIVPTPRVEVSDPAGAGDTVIATIGLGVAAVGFSSEVFALAAEAAACVVRHVGVATVSAEDLALLAQQGSVG